MAEKFNPLAYVTDRRNFARILGVAGLVPLAYTAGELENDNTNRQIMAKTAGKLTQEEILNARHNLFKRDIERDGYDISQYGLWHSTQISGLFQSVSEANRNPWITSGGIPYFSESLSNLRQKLRTEKTPHYDANIAVEIAGNLLNISSLLAAYNLKTDTEKIMNSNLHPRKKATRRALLQLAGVAVMGSALSGAGLVFSNPLNIDKKNYPEYHNIPAPVLEQLSYPDRYKAFQDYYHRNLSTLPDLQDSQLMSEEDYYDRWEKQKTRYQQTWAGRTLSQENEIMQKINYFMGCTYDAYKTRFEMLQDTALPYFRHIIHASPENPILTFQPDINPDITNTGFGLQLLEITRQSQPNVTVD